MTARLPSGWIPMNCEREREKNMKVTSLQLGLYQTNCYIIYDETTKVAAITDPGYTPELVLQKLDELGLHLDAILLTHGHFDHVGGVKEIAADTDCRVFLNERENAMPPMMTAGKLYATDFYDEGDTLTLASLTFTVLATPGHTPGSVCLDFGEDLFTGDTLFAGSCGRTDLPCGDGHQLRASLKKLAQIQGNRNVYPGHGQESDLDEERKSNPYLGGAL